LNTERTENTEFLSDAPVNLGIPYTIRKKNLGIPTFSCIWTKMSAAGGTLGFYFFRTLTALIGADIYSPNPHNSRFSFLNTERTENTENWRFAFFWALGIKLLFPFI
jgi:hypothetical protein